MMARASTVSKSAWIRASPSTRTSTASRPRSSQGSRRARPASRGLWTRSRRITSSSSPGTCSRAICSTRGSGGSGGNEVGEVRSRPHPARVLVVLRLLNRKGTSGEVLLAGSVAARIRLRTNAQLGPLTARPYRGCPDRARAAQVCAGGEPGDGAGHSSAAPLGGQPGGGLGLLTQILGRPGQRDPDELAAGFSSFDAFFTRGLRDGAGRSTSAPRSWSHPPTVACARSPRSRRKAWWSPRGTPTRSASSSATPSSPRASSAGYKRSSICTRATIIACTPQSRASCPA